jgi:hypothetical protein
MVMRNVVVAVRVLMHRRLQYEVCCLLLIILRGAPNVAIIVEVAL